VDICDSTLSPRMRRFRSSQLVRLLCVLAAGSSGLLLEPRALGQGQAVLISTGAMWRYFDGGPAPVDWALREFDESPWPTGFAQFGYGDGDEVTIVAPVSTVYFRSVFEAPDASAFSGLAIRLLRDDGAVVYLNGVELFRSNMPDGPIDYSTEAIDPVGGVVESTFFTNRIGSELLRNGPNVLAVEVHQVSPFSLDLSFDLELHADSAASISIVNPTNGQSFVFGNDILIETVTNHFTKDVIDVVFLANGYPIGHDTLAPFNYIWHSPGVTEFSLTAVAFSGIGLSVTSAPVHIAVINHFSPIINLNSSDDGRVFLEGADIILNAGAAATPNGILSSIEFFANGLKIGEVIDGTNWHGFYSLTWSNVMEGSYALQAVATDDAGVRGYSAIIHITVTSPRNDQPPMVSIIEPAEGATVRGPGNVPLRVYAFDNDGYVTRVEFFSSGVKIGQATVAPFNFIWEQVAVGTYTVTAVATDDKAVTNSSPPVSFSVAVIPAAVSRGPYLQSAAPTHMSVNWRTDDLTDSRVIWGTDSGHLDQTAQDSGSTIDHSVTLTGLNPDTKYFYAVGSSEAILAAAPDQFFITPPLSARQTRVWVLGDSGTASFAAQSVRDAYYDYAEGRYTDLWLMLGDNAYGAGTDEDYQAAVFNMYPRTLRQSVLWPTRGNHDVAPAYLDIFTLPSAGECGGVPSGTESYYSFDYGNIHFICLNAFNEDRSTNGPMLTWLREDLAGTAMDWIIAFWHHPPYSRGSHYSDFEIELIQMRQNAVPILEEYGADLVLCGHSHSYERSFLLHGHYGTSGTLTPEMKIDPGSGRVDGLGPYRKLAANAGPQHGTVYAVAGSSGQTSGGGLDHPAMFVSFNQLGSIVLDIDGPRLDAKFLQADGQVTDYFTIEKSPLTLPPLQISRSASQFLILWTKTATSTVLEATETLGPDAEWTVITNPRLEIGQQTGVFIENAGGNRFFRLRAIP
jgi:Calcineurin-like phosphoesterase/Bacterial Ig domain/Purple acid Phosphatase, N-terminal domain